MIIQLCERGKVYKNVNPDERKAGFKVYSNYEASFLKAMKKTFTASARRPFLTFRIARKTDNKSQKLLFVYSIKNEKQIFFMVSPI